MKPPRHLKPGVTDPHAKAQRLMQRAAGLRYTLAHQRMTPMKMAEMERTIRNLEGAAKALMDIARQRAKAGR